MGDMVYFLSPTPVFYTPYRDNGVFNFFPQNKQLNQVRFSSENCLEDIIFFIWYNATFSAYMRCIR